ncbi:hypothetical protein Rsub_07828 [Raphidocelis subcapitata]|uniref:Uncharacterized protein n=1 Tax=Raphidocelis subcapitata TaxID=307507 RepID=A0A2V0P6J6_9CHLO|nr:hypothetical protein Rsub_07828 [Raphidocelis subcapitata]|eukprot:GBF95478.1 hypothetical protein Rsub_07828 [Raphidocelis subcapitata]
MVFFVGAKSPVAGSRVAPSLPVRVLTGYARSEEEVALFREDAAAVAPAAHLEWEEALDAFPDGLIKAASFELHGARWRLHARAVPDGRRCVHLALRDGPPAGNGAGAVAHALLLTGPSPRGGAAGRRSPADSLGASSGAASSDDDGALCVAGGGGAAAFAADDGGFGDAVALCSADSADGSKPMPPRAAAARRKYVRDLVVATNPAHDSLGRYKALIALIEHCKSRARTLRPGAGTDWGREPAHSLLHHIVDVGEALAGFGNAQFPERSGEARAVLAADYKALLSEYLTHLGGVLVPGACRGLAPDSEAELRSVGSLLATRCAAYKVLYEQLVQNIGSGSGTGRGGDAQPVLIFNTNTNAVAASPVTHNTNTADACSKARAVNKGVGAAALGVAGLATALLVRALARRGGGGGGGGGASSSRRGDVPAPRVPRGRGGREMRLVSALSACGDEMRKAARNESLLQDDWRLGRLRLSWPPAPEPPGFSPIAPGVCDITGILQELY